MADLLSDFLVLAAELAARTPVQGERPAMLSFLRYVPDEQALEAATASARSALAGLRTAEVTSWVQPPADDDWHQPLGLDVTVCGRPDERLLSQVTSLAIGVREKGAQAAADEMNAIVPLRSKEHLAQSYAGLLVQLHERLGDPGTVRQDAGRGWTHIWDGDGGAFVESVGVVTASTRNASQDGFAYDIQVGAGSRAVPRARLGAFALPDADIPVDVAFSWSLGASTLPLIRLGGHDAAARFHAAINAFRATSPHGFCLMPWEIDQYRDHALYLTTDGHAGLAVGADGMLHSVFSAPSVRQTYGFRSGQPSPGSVLTSLALTMDARELNCFDNGFTRQFYERHGFDVIARFPFDPEQAIPGWRYGVYDVDGHEPDFLIMRLRGAR